MARWLFSFIAREFSGLDLTREHFGPARRRNLQRRIHDPGIELLTGILAQDAETLRERARESIGPVVGHRVQRVHHREYPRRQRDRLSREAVRVPGPVV